MNREEFQKAYGKLVAKAWADDDFKEMLLTDTMTVFNDNGISITSQEEVNNSAYYL